MSWVEPQEVTGSDWEVAPLPPKARVYRDYLPNSEGLHSWICDMPREPRRFFDTQAEAYATAMALVLTALYEGARVNIIGNRYAQQDGWHGVDYRGGSGTVVAIEPEHANPIEVELDHHGYSQMFHPSELEILP